MSVKAYDLLLAQPDSLAGKRQLARSRIVISALFDDDGREHVLSRFGDGLWDFTPSIRNPNVPPHQKVIRWPEEWPEQIVDDLKAIVYAWTRTGRPGWKPAVARTAIATIAKCAPLIEWMVSHGVRTFAELSQVHLATYLAEARRVSPSPKSVEAKFIIVDLAWAFRHELVFPLRYYPWGDSSLEYVTGVKGPDVTRNGVGTTPLIPREVQTTIFNYCMDVIAGASRLFEERDAGQRSIRSPELIKVRDACLYVLLITTGLRQDEAIGVENGAGRTELRNGVPYHWIRAEERKTGKGLVDYLAPELTLEVLRTAARFATPLQSALATEIAEIEQLLKTCRGKAQRLKLLKQLTVARRTVNNVFLAFSTRHNKVHSLTRGGVTCALRALARSAGVKWTLGSHQCRRTYARLIVESSMGRMGLVYLKEQFKHSSLSMTQRYALNPAQDAELMEEMLEESISLRQELLERWGSGQPLSGGAGRKIIQIRAVVVKDADILLRRTAEAITIRGTGHGWCIAQDGGCGGGGLYDASLCVDCKNGVIDREWRSIWEGIYQQHTELCESGLLTDGALARARRSSEAAAKVLAELGVERGS